MPRKNNKRLRVKEPEPETDIIVWPTDEEVYNDIKDEIEEEYEQVICIDKEISDIRDSLTQLRKDIYQLLESVIEIKKIVSYTPK
mgnify:CR=1 FL=1